MFDVDSAYSIFAVCCAARLALTGNDRVEDLSVVCFDTFYICACRMYRVPHNKNVIISSVSLSFLLLTHRRTTTGK